MKIINTYDTYKKALNVASVYHASVIITGDKYVVATELEAKGLRLNPDELNRFPSTWEAEEDQTDESYIGSSWDNRRREYIYDYCIRGCQFSATESGDVLWIHLNSPEGWIELLWDGNELVPNMNSANVVARFGEVRVYRYPNLSKETRRELLRVSKKIAALVCE